MHRRRIATALVAAAAATTLVGSSCSAGEDEARDLGAPTARESDPPEYFFSLSAGSGSTEPVPDDGRATATVVLSDVAPVTVAITERPRRQSSQLSTTDFVDGWNETFGDDPPNASIGVLGADGHQHEAAVEIVSASNAADDEVDLEVLTLSGDLPSSFSDATIVIDDADDADDADGAVRLNLVNESNDANNAQIVVAQQNQAEGFSGSLTVAWKVVSNLGEGDNQPFTFPEALEVSVSDAYGNATPKLQASPGDAFVARTTPSGIQLTRTGSSGSGPITVTNSLEAGTIDVDVYRADQLLGTRTAVTLEQSAEFEFDDTLIIGVVSQVEQGEVMNSAIVQQLSGELDLSGITSADIVLTGGGPGKDSTAFTFELEDVEE
jgi:hypothetical protein